MSIVVSQTWNWIKENILSARTYKLIFVNPLDPVHWLGVSQRYVGTKDKFFSFNGRDYPVDLADFIRQQGSRFIQYRDFNDMSVLYFYKAKSWVKPNGKLLSSRELNAARAADVAEAVQRGGKMELGVIILVMALAAGLMGGVLVGYFGLPALTGAHVVPLPTPLPVG